MKDEEMAEGYADNISGLELTCSLLSAKDKSHAYRLGRYDGFLAGLKADRPQWHKVADGDLPTTVGRRFLVSNRYCTMIGYWNGQTFVSVDEDTAEIANPIAWCEIPKFEAEK